MDQDETVLQTRGLAMGHYGIAVQTLYWWRSELRRRDRACQGPPYDEHPQFGQAGPPRFGRTGPVRRRRRGHPCWSQQV